MGLKFFVWKINNLLYLNEFFFKNLKEKIYIYIFEVLNFVIFDIVFFINFYIVIWLYKSVEN